MLFSEVANVVEKRPASLILKSFLCSRLAERLAGETRANDVHLGYVVNHLPDVALDIKVPWLTPVGLVDLGGMLVYIGRENTFMAQTMEGSMESPDAAEEIGETHQYPKDASG